MKPGHQEEVQNLYILIYLDARDLKERINKRKVEYLHRFNLSRTRSHFPDIFENRFSKLSMEMLHQLSEEIIISANEFYKEVEILFWYFKHTEDMGNTASDYLERELKKVNQSFEVLKENLLVHIRGEEMTEETV